MKRNAGIFRHGTRIIFLHINLLETSENTFYIDSKIELRDRLTAGHQVLALGVEVRVLVPQLESLLSIRVLYLSQSNYTIHRTRVKFR